MQKVNGNHDEEGTQPWPYGTTGMDPRWLSPAQRPVLKGEHQLFLCMFPVVRE